MKPESWGGDTAEACVQRLLAVGPGCGRGRRQDELGE